MAHVTRKPEVRVAGLTATRVALAAGETVAHSAAGGEAIAFVVRGGGIAWVAGEERPLAAESLVWLAGDDAATLEAGAAGLELLLAVAS